MLFSSVIPLMTFAVQLIFEYSTLTRQRPILVHILIRVLAFFLLVGGYVLLGRIGVKTIALYYFLTAPALLACILLFREALAPKIFLFFSNWLLTTAISSICNYLTAWFSPADIALHFRYAAYAVLLGAAVPLYIGYYRGRIREMLFLYEKGNHAYALFPILAFMLFSFLFNPISKDLSLIHFSVMIMFLGLIALAYYLMFTHFRLAYSRLAMESDLKNAGRREIIQKRYYDVVEKSLRTQQALLHDARHNLVALSTLVRDKDLLGLERHISKHLERFNQSVTPRYCRHSLANAVIGGYLDMAGDKTIPVSVELDIPENIGIHDYDLCTLFGNTIENAIEACDRIPEDSALRQRRYITVKSRVDSGRLTLRVENSFHSEARSSEEDFASSKGSFGGVGLKSVQAVVDRYQGSMSCDRQNETFTFSAVLCLNPFGAHQAS